MSYIYRGNRYSFYLKVDGDDRYVGSLTRIGKKMSFKRLIDFEKHFMKINQSFSISEITYAEIIEVLSKEKVTKKNCSVVFTSEVGNATIVYKTNFMNYVLNGKVMDYGQGKQRFLHIKNFNKIELYVAEN